MSCQSLSAVHEALGPSSRQYWWPVTSRPPSWADAVHRSVTDPSPGVAARPVGASGAVAGTSFVTGWSAKAAAGLLASSWRGFIAGTVYETVTVSPARTFVPPTAVARVRTTFVPPTETPVTAREAPSTVTVNAVGPGSEPASRSSS